MADRRRRRNSASESDSDTKAATADGMPSEAAVPLGDTKAAPATSKEAVGAEAGGESNEEVVYDEECSDSQEAGTEGEGEELSEEEEDEDEEEEEDEDEEETEDEDGSEDGAEVEEGPEGENAKEGDVKQRESGDGQEQTEAAVLDDDEDTKNPAYIPRKGLFYEHDLRVEEDGEAAARKNGAPERPKKKLWSDADRWLHDRYDDAQQRPKSREELISIYGFDIREHDSAPDGGVAMRGRGRGGRGYGSRGGRRPYQLGDYVQPSQRLRAYSRDDRSQQDEEEDDEKRGQRYEREAEHAATSASNAAARGSGEQDRQPQQWRPPPPPSWQRGQRGRGGYRGAPGSRGGGGGGEGARRGGGATDGSWNRGGGATDGSWNRGGGATDGNWNRGGGATDGSWNRGGGGRRTEWGPSRPPANRSQSTAAAAEPLEPASPAQAVAGESRTSRAVSGAVPSEPRQDAGGAAPPEMTTSAGGSSSQPPAAAALPGPPVAAPAGDNTGASGDAAAAGVQPAHVISSRRGDSPATISARADVQSKRGDQGGAGGPAPRQESHRQRDVRQANGGAQGARAAAADGDAKGSSQQQQQVKPKRYSTQRQRPSSPPPSSQRQPAVTAADVDPATAGALSVANLEFYSSQHSQAAVAAVQQPHASSGYVQHSSGISSLPVTAAQPVLPPATMMHGASPVMPYGGSVPIGPMHTGAPRLVFAHMPPAGAEQVLGGPRLSAQQAAAAQFLPAAGAASGIMQSGATMMYNISAHPASHSAPAGLPSGAPTYVMPPPGSLPVSYASAGARAQIMPGPQPGQEGFSVGGTTYYGAAAMMPPPDVISAGPQYYGDGAAAGTPHNNMFYYVPTSQPASRTPSRRQKSAIPIVRPEEIGHTQAGGEGLLPSGTDGAERLMPHLSAGQSIEYHNAAAGEPGYFSGVPVVYEPGTAPLLGVSKTVTLGSYSNPAGRPPDVAALEPQVAAVSLGSTEVAGVAAGAQSS